MFRTTLLLLPFTVTLALAQCPEGPFLPPRVEVMPLADPLPPRMPEPAPSPRYEARKADTRNVVLSWNEAAVYAIRVEKTPPPVAARNLALVHAAIYDAVSAVERSHHAFYVNTTAPRGASAEAAAAVAAHRALVGLYPRLAASFDLTLDDSLAPIPDGPARNSGIRLGQSIAENYLRWRGRDGRDIQVAYKPSGTLGRWEPTPPQFRAALLPEWASVPCYALRNSSHFRAPGPPPLASEEFAAAYREVKELGASRSTRRTPEQTTIAHFWADGEGTATPPGHWNRIARHLARRRAMSLADSARLLAMLNVALADTAICCWESKYHFDFWRPVTAIRQADRLKNAALVADRDWTPLLPTPSFPSYTSGHSTFSGAAAAVLAAFFGSDNVEFVSISDALPGTSRSFKRFSEAASEAGMSRIYGGIHWSFDNRDGLKLGREIGEYVATNYFQPNAEKPGKDVDPNGR